MPSGESAGFLLNQTGEGVAQRGTTHHLVKPSVSKKTYILTHLYMTTHLLSMSLQLIPFTPVK